MAGGAPDPAQARTLDEFALQLRSLKVWAGNPSITVITQRIHRAWRAAGRPRGEWPARATVGYCFRTGRVRPNPDLMLAVVAALLDGDPGALAAWRASLRAVLGDAEAAGWVSASDRLPDDVADFTGRVGVLRHVLHDLTAAPAGSGDRPICVIEGMAGIGKTAFAVHLAHRMMAADLADHTLFVNLHGVDPRHPPASPVAVLESFLRVLGVPGEQIPHTLDGRAALYRRRLATTRTLVMLDNAAGADQVVALLPGSPRCPVLVTSRTALPDVAGARHLRLPVFARAEATHLLRRAAGADRVSAAPDTAGHIVDLLGYLPFAVSVIGRHLKDHPDWALPDYPPALAALALEGGVRAALALSDSTRPAPARRLLRLLALHPGTDIDAAAAAELSDQDIEATRRHLASLTTANLLHERVPGRYALHDLTHAYAAERAGLDLPGSHTRAALSRLFDHYAGTAEAAAGIAYPYEATGGGPGGSGAFGEARQAEQWLDAELDNLLATATHAADNGWPEHTLRLSATLHRHLRTRARHDHAGSLHRCALATARATGNSSGELVALIGLGHIHYLQGQHRRAAECFTTARRLAGETGHRTGEREALLGLGHIHGIQGRPDQAVGCFERALRVARAAGHPTGEHDALYGLGHIHYLQSRYAMAAECFTGALLVAQSVDHRTGEQNALYGLGFVHEMLGRYREAADLFRQMLQVARMTGSPAGSPTGELYALRGLGYVHYAQGQYQDAVRHCRRALGIAQATGNRHGEQRALVDLGNIRVAQRRYRRGASHHRNALRIAGETGDPNGEFEAHLGLGRCHRATGQHHDALAAHRTALHLASTLGQPRDQARAHDGLAHTHEVLGNHVEAHRHWRTALHLLTTAGTSHTEDPQVTTAAIRTHLAGRQRQAVP